MPEGVSECVCELVRVRLITACVSCVLLGFCPPSSSSTAAGTKILKSLITIKIIRTEDKLLIFRITFCFLCFHKGNSVLSRLPVALPAEVQYRISVSCLFTLASSSLKGGLVLLVEQAIVAQWVSRKSLL